MIFRRTPEPVPQKKPTTTGRPTQSVQRREPEIAPRSLPMASNGPALHHAPMPAPVSPHATAQARRTMQPQGPSHARHEQMRKLIVGREISLNGEIETCDHLVVEGTVKATIKGGQILEISETGSFSGTVDIDSADISGQFDGTLTVRNKLTIRPTAIVNGILYYNRLQVDTGATINGELNALKAIEQKPVDTAPVQQTLYTASTPARTNDAVTEEQRLFTFSAFNDEPGFLKASA